MLIIFINRVICIKDYIVYSTSFMSSNLRFCPVYYKISGTTLYIIKFQVPNFILSNLRSHPMYIIKYQVTTFKLSPFILSNIMPHHLFNQIFSPALHIIISHVSSFILSNLRSLFIFPYIRSLFL